MQEIIGVVINVVVWILLIGFVLLFFVIIGFWIVNFLGNIIGWDRIFPEKFKQAAAAYNERLFKPAPEEVETFLGGKLPTSVLELYENHELLDKSDICFNSPTDVSEAGKWYVAYFTPCRVEDQKHNFLPKQADKDNTEEGDCRFFEFASDGWGNSFYVQLADENQDDVPVYFLDHDGGELFEKVADSVRVFLSWPCTTNSSE